MGQLKCPHRGCILRYVGFQWMDWIVIYATLFGKCYTSAQIIVDPPSGLRIEDPGYLGTLDISWQAPFINESLSHCTVLYELHFQSGGDKRWRSVRTKQLKYRDAFNLSKGAAVKLRTYLKDCVNRSPVWSDWIETNYSAPLQGNPGSQIENFHCVHYDWESLQCNWNPGKKLASNSNYELMFWHIELARPKTCSKYLSKNGINIGCVFQSQDLEDFTEFFVHVTGIPGLSPVQSSYFVLQLQDLVSSKCLTWYQNSRTLFLCRFSGEQTLHIRSSMPGGANTITSSTWNGTYTKVKPSAPEDISLTMTASDKLSVEWKIPKGKILLRCLRYEIQFKDEKDIWKTIEAERVSTITISKSNSSHLMCVRIRGKLNKYCANDGYWSDWSPDTCWKEPQSTYTNLLFYCIGGGILTLTGLCVIAAILHVISKRHWSKKLQHKAKQLVCDVEVSNVLS